MLALDNDRLIKCLEKCENRIQLLNSLKALISELNLQLSKSKDGDLYVETSKLSYDVELFLTKFFVSRAISSSNSQMTELIPLGSKKNIKANVEKALGLASRELEKSTADCQLALKILEFLSQAYNSAKRDVGKIKIDVSEYEGGIPASCLSTIREILNDGFDLELEVKYKNDKIKVIYLKREGLHVCKYPSSDAVKHETYYVNGKKEGIKRCWDVFGSLKSKARYENGILRSKTTYNSSGQVISETIY
jgi:hypothetical protein